ncbi:hypothetical protein KP509_1Z009900 [Ceratopteris richardii]|nr:hypothetical protein KP509_1Z009900 [Ceratopteris richardii]
MSFTQSGSTLKHYKNLHNFIGWRVERTNKLSLSKRHKYVPRGGGRLILWWPRTSQVLSATNKTYTSGSRLCTASLSKPSQRTLDMELLSSLSVQILVCADA